MAKALIGGIQKFSTSDGPGIRTTVFVKGCPLRCRWCHNPELISFKQQLIRSKKRCIGCGACVEFCAREAIAVQEQNKIQIDRLRCDNCMKCTEYCYAEALRPAARLMDTEEIFKTALQDRDYYSNTGGGITLSGGEILSHKEFALEFSALCIKEKIGFVIDTSGYGSYGLLHHLSLDAQEILYDIKSLDEAIHERYTGVGNEKILWNLKKLSANQEIRRKIQIRMPLIHQVNDGIALIEKTAVFLKSCGLSSAIFLPYHELGTEKARGLGLKERIFEAPPQTHIRKLENIMRERGLEIKTPSLT